MRVIPTISDRFIYYYQYYHFTHCKFSHQHKLVLFHLSLSDSKSPQVSRTLLNILADINIVVV